MTHKMGERNKSQCYLFKFYQPNIGYFEINLNKIPIVIFYSNSLMNKKNQ